MLYLSNVRVNMLCTFNMLFSISDVMHSTCCIGGMHSTCYICVQHSTCCICWTCYVQCKTFVEHAMFNAKQMNIPCWNGGDEYSMLKLLHEKKACSINEIACWKMDLQNLACWKSCRKKTACWIKKKTACWIQEYSMLKAVKAAWWNQRRPNSRFKCVYYVLKRVYSIWCIIVMVLMPSIIDCFRPLKKEFFWSAQACACAALKTELCSYFRHACAKQLVCH